MLCKPADNPRPDLGAELGGGGEEEDGVDHELAVEEEDEEDEEGAEEEKREDEVDGVIAVTAGIDQAKENSSSA